MEGTNERTGALSLKFLASVWNMKYASISRGAERVRWDIQFKEVRKVRKIGANDHVVADCRNLVFYSAFYWQPVQIHKKGGNMFAPYCPNLVFYSAFYWQPEKIQKKGANTFAPASVTDMTSSTVQHTLNFAYTV